jgi:hypothetical protein
VIRPDRDAYSGAGGSLVSTVVIDDRVVVDSDRLAERSARISIVEQPDPRRLGPASCPPSRPGPSGCGDAGEVCVERVGQAVVAAAPQIWR